MNKVLLCVDPQNDFITGSMKVDGAKGRMAELGKYIKSNDDYKVYFITVDWHPHDHISFNQWPQHCVKYSSGAAINDSVFKNIIEKDKAIYKVYRKGQDTNIEQYSAFDVNEHKDAFSIIMKGWQIDQIDVCGIVGTICVKNTIEGLIQMGYKDEINVLTKYVANFNDDDTEFLAWLDDNNIRHE